jgi:hypothetical protein
MHTVWWRLHNLETSSHHHQKYSSGLQSTRFYPSVNANSEAKAMWSLLHFCNKKKVDQHVKYMKDHFHVFKKRYQSVTFVGNPFVSCKICLGIVSNTLTVLRPSEILQNFEATCTHHDLNKKICFPFNKRISRIQWSCQELSKPAQNKLKLCNFTLV